MTLLNPIWLWTLSALAIPVGIHLLSRKEGNTIRIGSIRFLTETSTSKFSSIRLNEIALLAIRSLLVLLIVVFLAGLILSSVNDKVSSKWVVVEKRLQNDSHIKNLLDSLQKDDHEIRILTNGFPLEDSDTSLEIPDYYKLTEQLAQKKTEAVVIASNAASGFKGKRISLPDNVRWLSYPASHNEIQREEWTNRDTLRITLVSGNEFQYDKKIISAALQSLETMAPAKLILTEIPANNLTTLAENDWLIWLSADTLTHHGKLLRYSDRLGSLIQQESKNTWILTKRLDAEIAVNEHLSIQLMNMLFEGKAQQINSLSIPNELAWSRSKEIQSASMPQSSSADKIIIVLLMLTFIAERILAYYRKQ